AGVATVYAAYATEVQSAAPADRATVAHALGRLGLHRAAVRVLAPGADGVREPAVAVTLAEETFASGDIGSARKLLVRLDPSRLRPDLAERAHALGARVALAGGDLERAAAEATAADGEGAWAAAADAYTRALAAGATPPERMLAAAGLVRIARARGEPARAAAALAALRATDDELARRVGRALEARAGHGS